MKRILILLFAFVLVGLPFGLPALILQRQVTPEATPTGAPMLADWTNTPSPSPTATNEPTPAAVCIVTTGIQDGRANIRACSSRSCAVLAAALEGDALQVVTPGLWHEVKTGGNTTGFIYSELCKKGH